MDPTTPSPADKVDGEGGGRSTPVFPVGLMETMKSPSSDTKSRSKSSGGKKQNEEDDLKHSSSNRRKKPSSSNKSRSSSRDPDTSTRSEHRTSHRRSKSKSTHHRTTAMDSPKTSPKSSEKSSKRRDSSGSKNALQSPKLENSPKSPKSPKRSASSNTKHSSSTAPKSRTIRVSKSAGTTTPSSSKVEGHQIRLKLGTAMPMAFCWHNDDPDTIEEKQQIEADAAKDKQLREERLRKKKEEAEEKRRKKEEAEAAAAELERIQKEEAEAAAKEEERKKKAEAAAAAAEERRKKEEEAAEAEEKRRKKDEAAAAVLAKERLEAVKERLLAEKKDAETFARENFLELIQQERKNLELIQQERKNATMMDQTIKASGNNSSTISRDNNNLDLLNNLEDGDDEEEDEANELFDDDDDEEESQSIRSVSPVHEAPDIDHLISPESSPVTKVNHDATPKLQTKSTLSASSGHGILRRAPRHCGLLGEGGGLLDDLTPLERRQDSIGDDESVEPRQQVDYYRNPTLLSRLIQFQRFESALARLEEFPHEASIWLVAKRLESTTTTRESYSNSRGQPSQASESAMEQQQQQGVVKLEQLPLHMACQQLAVHNQSSILLELLTQLLLVYPQACEYPDHTGAYAIHYMVQNRAAPELLSLALIAHPPSCNINSPKGKTLKQLFHYAWNDGFLSLFHDSGFVTSLTSLMSSNPSFMSSSNGLGGGACDPRGLAVPGADRASRRQQQQIAQLLDFDESFWKAAHEESAAVQMMQKSWKKEKQKTNSVKETRSRTPWKMLREKNFGPGPGSTDGTERTTDETVVDFGGESDEDGVARRVHSKRNVYAEQEEEEILAMSWGLLEHRTFLMEQLLLETADQNIDLQERVTALAKKTISTEEASTLQRTELARQSYALRQENEALKRELRMNKLDLAKKKREQEEADAKEKAANDPAMRRRASINLGDMIIKQARMSAAKEDTRSEGSISFPFSVNSEGSRETTSPAFPKPAPPRRQEEALPPRDPSPAPFTRETEPPSDPPPLISYGTPHSLFSSSSPAGNEKQKATLVNIFDATAEKVQAPVDPEETSKAENTNSSEETIAELEKQREANRLMHEEYRSLAEKYRAQEASLRRMEATLDTLLFGGNGQSSSSTPHPTTPGKGGSPKKLISPKSPADFHYDIPLPSLHEDR